MDYQQIEKYANFYGYSDVEPYEVVRVISPTTVEIRRMNTKLLNGGDLKFHIGGFSANCSNGDVQEYAYTSNTNAPIERIRWSKANNRWQQGRHTHFSMSEKPRKFHDYNF